MGRPPRIRRDQLLDTARRVFAAKGFAAATLADIAGELGVTPAALLRHVRSKDELFAEAMHSAEIIEPPACILVLASTPGTEDPRVVLRRIAEEFVPFAERVIGSHIVVAQHTSLVLPFNPDSDSPPRRGFPIVADYFRRAAAAGRLRVRDPRAAALLFMGSLQGYVLFHHVLKMPTVCSLSEYIDTLIDLWCEGAIVGGAHGPTTKRARAPHRGAGAGGGSRRRGRAVLPARAGAEGDRPLRNARGANGQRRVARRRPGDKDARR
jgi:AcrR family transcriptional regulator